MCFCLEGVVCLCLVCILLQYVFCMICNISMFVEDAIAFLFYLPHVVEVRALIICSDWRALVARLSMCVLYVVNLGSSVRPKIGGCMFMGNVVLCIVRPSCVLYSCMVISAWSYLHLG